MKQILQNLKDGATKIADVPAPLAGHGQLLIRTRQSLVSAGTERMLVEFGKANLIEKARQQPDKVRMVLDKVRNDGLMPTLEAVRSKLGQPLPMGYCNVGAVVAVGRGVSNFAVGDRVVSNGRHAEVVAVPVNLCARVPDGVSDEAAVFTVLASIGLQGIRLTKPTLGECIVVTGLGLIGLLTVQLLRANGCRVMGLDFDPAKLKLARSYGAEVVNLGDGVDPVAAAMTFSRDRGVDAVIISAATRSNDPVHQAALMCRKRGRIVLVGVAGLELSRADFYEKELTFQVSCSYGPGRYDPAYEQGGNDYPVGHVRWTEQRNFEAALDMLAEGRIDVSGLVSHRYPLEQAVAAYEVVGGTEPSLGIILEYPRALPSDSKQTYSRTVSLQNPGVSPADSGVPAPVVSFIGAGSYAGAVLIPAFRDAGSKLRYVAGAGGPGSVHLGRKFGFARATTDCDELMGDTEANIVAIATRHDSHARYVIGALGAGKNVFVEKPLCLTREELAGIVRAMEGQPSARVMVGFNRRFSPHV
jgi:threonine dehydrogenase-like Zn-dependent dehydrogenase